MRVALRGEPVERGVERVDLGLETAVPEDEYTALVVHVMDDAAVSGLQAGVLDGGSELDAHPDRHARSNAGGEKLGTVGVHDRLIGFAAEDLDPSRGDQAAGEAPAPA